MIDINSSLVIQLVNFLILLIALNVLLFKPIRKIIQDREQGISAALHDAQAAQKRIQELQERYTASLTEAKHQATAIYHALLQQGLDAQRDMIAAERAAAGELLDKARIEIVAASAAAKAGLAKDAEALSQAITSKLLGRAI